MNRSRRQTRLARRPTKQQRERRASKLQQGSKCKGQGGEEQQPWALHRVYPRGNGKKGEWAYPRKKAAAEKAPSAPLASAPSLQSERGRTESQRAAVRGSEGGAGEASVGPRVQCSGEACTQNLRRRDHRPRNPALPHPRHRPPLPPGAALQRPRRAPPRSSRERLRARETAVAAVAATLRQRRSRRLLPGSPP